MIFKPEELEGKELIMKVGVSEEEGYRYTCLMGYEKSTGHTYVISNTVENIQDKPKWDDCWHCFGDGVVDVFGIEERWEERCVFCNAWEKRNEMDK